MLATARSGRAGSEVADDDHGAKEVASSQSNCRQSWTPL